MTVTPELLDLAKHHRDLAPLKLWTSAVAAAPVVLIIPALGTPAGVYRRSAEALCAAGIHAAVLELRGVGESPVRASRRYDFGYADLVDAEVHGALQLLGQRFPGVAPLVCGHSLGGHLAFLHQARHPQHVLGGVLLMASGAPYHRAYPGLSGWATRSLGLFARTSTRLLGYFPGHWLGFGGRQGATLMREWGEFVRTGQPQVHGWSEVPLWRERLAELKLPVLALTMPGDSYAPESSTRHLVGLTAADLRHQRMSLQEVGAGHFAFLKNPQAVVDRAAAFARELKT
jgi:predicted alpha/beta hydrolase